MAKKTCTPFCDTRKTCPKHHDLLLTLTNCSERKDQESNALFEEFQSTVKACQKKGWSLDGVIPDPVRNYRFPLLHWAAVMGKTRALEWMINFGFDVTIRTSGSQETALHRTVVCLQLSGQRHFKEKVKQLVHLLKDCLPLQDKALQTPLHTAAMKLVTDTSKTVHYIQFVKAIVAKAIEIPEKTAEILNAKDQHGNTALHYLAQNNTGVGPLCCIIQAGGDVSILNKKKLKPLDFAMNYGCTSIIKALNSTGKMPNLSCHDDIVYTAESPPASPANLSQSGKNHQDDEINTSNVENQPDGTHSKNADTCTATLECNEDISFSTSASDASPGELPCAMNEVSSAIENTTSAAPNSASGSTADDAASAVADVNNEMLQTACSEVSCEDRGVSEATLDALSVNTDEAGGAHLEEECRCTSIGMQTPVLNQYSCIVHIKQERKSPCERCQQESLGEISSSSEMQSITTTDMAHSVLTLLRGAGLLENLTEIAEKRRTEDEHVLTEKLEMVKETNNELESSSKEIEEKGSKIERLSAELEELKQQVQTKVDERERLLLKRKSLNEECNSLQKKLHCCDSLLKVVPKVTLNS